MEVFLPKRPGSALQRANRVDGAAFGAVGAGLEENAIFAGLLFAEAVFEGDPMGVTLFEFVCGNFHKFRCSSDFRWADPDVTLFGAAAAIAATLTGKGQAVAIPLFFTNDSHKILR